MGIKKLLLLILIPFVLFAQQDRAIRESDICRFSRFTGVNDSLKMIQALSTIGDSTTNLWFSKKTYDFGFHRIPKNIKLIFDNGAVILDSLEIYGDVDAGRYQIFSSGVRLVNTSKAYPEWFGAKADTSINSRTGLQRALNSCSAIDIGGNSYMTDSTLNIANKTIISDNGVIYLKKGVTSTYILYGAGSKSSTGYKITADAPYLTNYVSLSSGDIANFKIGDLVAVSSNKAFDGSTTTKQGDYHTIRNISGTQMTFNEVLNDSFKLSDSTKLYKITPATFNISGKLKLYGQPATQNDLIRGIALWYMLRPDVNVELYNCFEFGVSLYSCYAPKVRVFANNSYVITNTGTGACILIGNYTSYADITGSAFFVRHAVSTGSSGDGISWENKVHNFIGYGGVQYLPVFDAHEATGSITYENCEAHGYQGVTYGFVLGARYNYLYNNKCYTYNGVTIRSGGTRDFIIDGLLMKGYRAYRGVYFENHPEGIDRLVIKNIKADYEVPNVNASYYSSTIYLNACNIRSLYVDGIETRNIPAFVIDSSGIIPEELKLNNITVNYDLQNNSDRDIAFRFKNPTGATRIYLNNVNLNNVYDGLQLNGTATDTSVYQGIYISGLNANSIANNVLNLNGYSLEDVYVRNSIVRNLLAPTAGVIKANKNIRNLLINGSKISNQYIVRGTGTVTYMNIGSNQFYEPYNLVPDSASKSGTSGVGWWTDPGSPYPHLEWNSVDKNVYLASNGNNSYILKSNLFPKGDSIYVSFIAKSPNSTKSPRVYLGKFGGTYVQSGTQLATSWRTFTFGAISDSTNLIIYPVGYVPTATGDTVYIDDIVVKDTKTDIYYVRTDSVSTIEILNGSPTDIRLCRIYGSPEGRIVAFPGAIALRYNGTAANALYVKETGSGNTGWKRVNSDTLDINAISVTGHSQFGGNVTISGNAEFNDTTTFNNHSEFNHNVSISGNTTISGLTEFNSDVNFTDTVGFSEYAYFDKSVLANGLNVSSNLTVGDSIKIGGVKLSAATDTLKIQSSTGTVKLTASGDTVKFNASKLKVGSGTELSDIGLKMSTNSFIQADSILSDSDLDIKTVGDVKINAPRTKIIGKFNTNVETIVLAAGDTTFTPTKSEVYLTPADTVVIKYINMDVTYDKGNYLLITTDGSHNVRIQDNTGNLKLNSDFILNNRYDTMWLHSVGAYWVEVARSDNQ